MRESKRGPRRCADSNDEEGTREITRKDRQSLWKFSFLFFFFPARGKGTVTRRVSPISRGTATYYWLHFVLETIVQSLFTISPIPPGFVNYCLAMRALWDVDREMYSVPRAQQETRKT